MLFEINVAMDNSQRIKDFGGFWWLKPFNECLGVGSVINQGHGIKKRKGGTSSLTISYPCYICS